MLLSALTFPLWFVKMFIDVAVLPDVEGNMHRIIYRYSMYENVCELIGPFFPCLAMAIAASVILLNAINIVLRKKNLQIVCNVMFCLTVALFLFLAFVASCVGRNY